MPTPLTTPPTIGARFKRYFAADKWVARFYLAKSFLINLFTPLIVFLPDLLHILLTNWSMVDAIPRLSPEWKITIFAAMHVAAAYARTRKQPNMPTPTIPVAVVPVPDTINLVTGAATSVPVATQIQEVAGADVADATRTNL